MGASAERYVTATRCKAGQPILIPIACHLRPPTYLALPSRSSSPTATPLSPPICRVRGPWSGRKANGPKVRHESKRDRHMTSRPNEGIHHQGKQRLLCYTADYRSCPGRSRKARSAQVARRHPRIAQESRQLHRGAGGSQTKQDGQGAKRRDQPANERRLAC